MPGTVVTLTALGAAIIPKITPLGTYRDKIHAKQPGARAYALM